MRGGDEIFIGRKNAKNEVMLLFRNEANQPMPRVLAFNEKLCKEPLMNTFF